MKLYVIHARFPRSRIALHVTDHAGCHTTDQNRRPPRATLGREIPSVPTDAGGAAQNAVLGADLWLTARLCVSESTGRKVGTRRHAKRRRRVFRRWREQRVTAARASFASSLIRNQSSRGAVAVVKQDLPM